MAPRTRSGAGDPTVEASGSAESPRLAPAPGLLIVFAAGRSRLERLALGDRELAIGRGDFGLDDDRLSRRHFEIAHREGRFVVRDLGSRNGTFVDGARVAGELSCERPTVLRAGDTLLLPVADARRFEGAAIERAGGRVVGPVLARARSEIERAAAVSPRLSLVAEPGSGRSLWARHFHEIGPAAGGPFVEIGPGALDPRDDDLQQRIAAARAGTLHVAIELEPEGQGRLARALAAVERKGPLRLVASSSRPLRAERADGRLGEALVAHLFGAEVAIPPLRRRIEEIPALVEEALARSRPGAMAHVSLVERALGRPWFGNARELMGEIAAAAARAGSLDPEEVSVRARHLAEAAESMASGPARRGGELSRKLEEELRHMSRRKRQTLELLLGGASEKQVADRLGLSPHTVHEYVGAIYKDLGVRSRGELLARWVGAGE